ncbi:MAG TPA: hypothetical protein PLR41_19735 [Alphaproteobacteria bacterium]|nr:hypothetical protein [Alphaproteobacteria bacterium]
MKKLPVALFLAVIGLSTRAGWAEITAGQTQQAIAFRTEVQALDPHTNASELDFQVLVAKYVRAAGPIQDFLDFMTASGFKCPPVTSLAYDQFDGSLVFRCTFEPDLGSTGEPSLSSVVEVSVFGVVAHSDVKLTVTKVDGYMTHGLTGP